MTHLTDLQLGRLLDPIVDAFGATPPDFWQACCKHASGIRADVAEGPFRIEVGAALRELNSNDQAAPLLGDLLLARPGDGPLREAVREVHPAAISAVSERRFKVEQEIERALVGEQATNLRDSLDRIDELMKAVVAYKSMHDGLHMLQPLLSLLRGAAAVRSRWPELNIYPLQFHIELAAMDQAASALAVLGRGQQLSFRDQIREALDALAAALVSKQEYDVRDAASQLSSSVERGLDIIDVMMLAAAEEATAPVTLAMQVLDPLARTAGDTPFGALINSYLDFARQVATELQCAIKEHGRWQQLDRHFALLQRTVIESQPSAVGEIENVWRLATKQLDALCAGAPPPGWAVGIVDLLCLAREALVPPIVPPVADDARDRVSAIISNGRNRFMQVDKALLDWLSQSAGRRPQLISLLRGDDNGAP